MYMHGAVTYPSSYSLASQYGTRQVPVKTQVASITLPAHDTESPTITKNKPPGPGPDV